MFLTKINTYRKFISLVASFSLLVNSFAAPVTIIAQELSTPESTPVVEETPVAEPTEVPVEPEVTVEPSSEPASEPTLTPTVTATASPLPEEEVILTGDLSVNATAVEETIIEDPLPAPDFDDPVESSSATLTSSVSTDKADYAPTDQVIITATDLNPNTVYLLKITSSDPPPVNFETNSTSDENGSFVYNYQLDGTYRPNYLVEIFLGGTLITSTTFTDSHTPAFDCQADTAGANDYPGQKDLSEMCIDDGHLPTSIDVTWNWDDIAWSGNNSGDACSLYDTDGDGNANYSLCVIIKGDPASYDSTALYSCGDDSPFKCTQPLAAITPSAGTTCTASVKAEDPFLAGNGYPNDTVAECSVALSDVGGTGIAQLIDVCSYPSQRPNSDPEDCVVFRDNAGKLEVQKELIPDTDSGLFNLLIDSVIEAANVGDTGTTGEISVLEGNHDVSETAGTNTDLSKYSTSLVCRDLNGTGSIVYQSTGTGPHSVNVPDQSDIVCVFTNEVAVGNIIVDKVTDPSGDSQSFDFVVTGAGYSNFSLTDAATPNDQELLAGIYSVSETVPAGWDLTSATCDDGSSVDAIDLAANETVTCTFTNTKLASVTVVKDVVPNDGTVWDFLLSGPGQFANGILDLGDGESETVVNLLPGDYTLSESTQEGYSTQVSCDTNEVGSDNVDFTLEPGEEVTCTFTNTKLGKIIVEKQTNPNNSPQTFSFTASYDNDGFDLLDGQQNDSGYLAAGTYSVFENVPAGWNLTSSTCSDRSLPSSINLAAGEVVTCVFTNTQYATIVVEKQTNPDGASGNFDFTGALSGTISDGGTLSANNVLPGQYEVTESDPTTVFDLTGISCTDNNSTGDLATRTATFNVEAGETITCTFTNTERGSIAGYKYEDEDGDTTTNDVTGVLNWTIELYSCSQDFLTCAFQSSTNTAADGSYNFAALIPGYYQVREILSNGWTNLTSLFHNVTVDAGEDETDLNFINFELATIIVHKDVFGPFGADVSDSQEFSVLLNGDNQEAISEGNDVTYSDLGPGTYTITENTPPSGYELDSITDNGVVEVTSGGEFHVYIRNNQLAGELTVIKHVVNDDGGTLAADDFTMNVSGTDVSDPSFPGDENGTVVSLNAGEYSVDEGFVAGYTKSLSEDCSGSIGFGESKTCTITNDDQPGEVLACKYEDLTGDGPSEDDTLLDGVTINLGNRQGTDSQVTENGCVTFEDVSAGSYRLWEVVPEGFYKTYPQVEQYNVVVTNGSSNEEEPFLFYNARLSAIGDFIWEDLDLDGFQDAGEPAFAGIVVNLYKDDGDGIGEPGTDDVFVGTATTGADGLYLFEGLVAGDYWVVVDTDSVPAGYIFTTQKRYFVSVFGGTTYLDADFGLVSPSREIEITKSNDKEGGANLGDTVNYTLKVENIGQVDLYNLVVFDVLPGGFSYVLGSTLVNGAPFADPTDDGGKLTWSLGLIEAGETIEIKYQATIANDLDPATYVNIATCTADSLGEVRERDVQSLVLAEGNEVIECNLATSRVGIGGSSSLTGGVGGQVLGAAIALPASGNETGLLFIFLALIAAGSIIKYANKKYLEKK